MEKSNKSLYALSEHEVFMREFIALYKQQPVLWDQKHPQYRNRAERTEAYEVLVKKCQEYHSDADEDFVKMKIDSMRSTFRKERRKVLNSKKNSESPEDIYKPSLWYYDLLLFTSGEEANNENSLNNASDKEEMSLSPNNLEDGNLVKIPFWSRTHSAMLISFYKKYPCLYSVAHPFYRNKRKRNEAVKKITEKLKATTGKYFHAEDVKRKISLIRGQFLYEYKKIKNSESMGEVYQPTLWCFEILNFLTKEYNQGQFGKRKELNMNLRRKNKKSNSCDESEEDLDIKKESDSSLSSESAHLNTQGAAPENNDDIFDTIAKNIGHKLRDMTEEQRNIAERIVKDVMYHGQMENLTNKSRLSLDGS